MAHRCDVRGVAGGAEGYVSVCTLCGFTGPVRHTPADAEADAEAHESAGREA